MKTKTNIQKCTVLVVLLIFSTTGHSQSPLTNAPWQQRAKELAAELKNEWAEGFNEWYGPRTRSQGVPQVDLMNAEYIPISCFTMDYTSYLNLSPESNLDFLIKSDEKHIDYVVKKGNEVVVQTGGILMDGQWISNGFGIYSQVEIDFITQLFAKNTSLCKLRVSISPESDLIWGYYTYTENGQLMCFRPEMPEPKPLLETLLQFKANQERRARLGVD